jgi:hypothetical protein
MFNNAHGQHAPSFAEMGPNLLVGIGVVGGLEAHKNLKNDLINFQLNFCFQIIFCFDNWGLMPWLLQEPMNEDLATLFHQHRNSDPGFQPGL